MPRSPIALGRTYDREAESNVPCVVKWKTARVAVDPLCLRMHRWWLADLIDAVLFPNALDLLGS